MAWHAVICGGMQWHAYDAMQDRERSRHQEMLQQDISKGRERVPVQGDSVQVGRSDRMLGTNHASTGKLRTSGILAYVRVCVCAWW